MNFIAKHLNAIGLLLLTAFVATAAGMYFNVPARISKSLSVTPSVTEYFCPMHPDVVAAKPGDCPKCGMALTPAATKTQGKSTMCQHADVSAQNDEAAPTHSGCNHTESAGATGGCCAMPALASQTPTPGGCTRFMAQPSTRASE